MGWRWRRGVSTHEHLVGVGMQGARREATVNSDRNTVQ